jgi:alpha-D-ribose 1-methylphosphonate 5-triphosphate diphosphatase
MTQDLIFANARLILADEVVYGSLHVRDGLIVDIDTGKAVPVGAVDVEGDFIAPGLVELHTDNLERHLIPRPQINWPHRAAIIAHDRELAGTGITTVFDAICVGSNPSRNRRPKYARQMADELIAIRKTGALRISHHIHLRAEICSETLLEELAEFSFADHVGIVSMMDHTPGQRQFTDMDKYMALVCGKHGLAESELDGHIAFLRGLQVTSGAAHEQAIVAAAKRYGATLASHDDTTTAQVACSHAHGVKLGEFPTTLEAAQACHAAGIKTIMGAPNIVRGF